MTKGTENQDKKVRMQELYYSFLERLHRYMKQRGLSYHGFGIKAGFASGGLWRIFKEQKSFGVEKLLMILDAYRDMNPEWVLFGEGPMILNDAAHENWLKETELGKLSKLELIQRIIALTHQNEGLTMALELMGRNLHYSPLETVYKAQLMGIDLKGMEPPAPSTKAAAPTMEFDDTNSRMGSVTGGRRRKKSASSTSPPSSAPDV